MKQEIIRELKEFGVCSYTQGQEGLSEADWQDIAKEVGEDIYYDSNGMSYTRSGHNRHVKLVVI